mgnify:CR=1 FL=1|jgi:hypothetical protein
MPPVPPAAAEAAAPPEAEVEVEEAADGDPACRKAVFFKMTKNRVSRRPFARDDTSGPLFGQRREYIIEQEGTEMKSTVILFSVLFLVSVLCFPLQAAEKAKPAESRVIQGEFLVLFPERQAVLAFEGKERAAATSVMLDMQAEYLKVRYGVSVENTFSAISETTGKGMFFVTCEKAKEIAEYQEKLLEEMRADPLIEAVSPNEVRKMISVPVKPQ